jgi:DNA polymerase-3 subunit alpha
MAFVHLHVHSEYSLLDGLAGVSELVNTAADMGMEAVAITDHGNMFGVIDFYKAAKQRGLKPIIGCEVYTAARGMEDRDPVLDRDQGHLILLAENMTGYHNLVKIVSAANMQGFYYKPRVDKELLSKYSKGLIALSACLGGDIPEKLMRNTESTGGNIRKRPEYDEDVNYEEAKKEALDFEEIFGKGNFFLELQNQGLEEETFILPFMKRLSADTGIPLVATNDVHYLKQEHAKAHDVLLCIQTGKLLTDEIRMRFDGDQYYLRSEEEMRKLFADLPEAVDITTKIAERCEIEFDFTGQHLPEFIAPSGKTNEEYLRELCASGLKERYGDKEEQYRSRLEHELSIIENMGFVEYFLIVWDFIKYARDNGIPVGPGRGSAAGSIVSYALHITDIDPIKYNLIFERFLNPERVSMPDIDIDFCDERRGEVIDYVVEKYGEDKVAQIITFGTLKAKAVIRDVGRVINMPLDKVDRIAKLVPNMPLDIDLNMAIDREPRLREMIRTDGEVERLFDFAKVLEGKSRHAGTHAAGVVITKKALDEYLPLVNSKNGVATQFTMNTVQDLGLLKMDFLGLRNLSVIDDAIKMIEAGHGVKIDFSAMEMDDPDTFKLLSTGNTDGVFQLESPGMRELIQKMKPDNFEDIIVAISLYRPGPMDKIPEYLRNRNRPDGIKYAHPLLEPILGVTFGVAVYQEQVMQIVRDLAGYDYARSDDIRRVMSKKKADEMQMQREVFVNGCQEANEIPERISNKLFDDMTDFASYAFNKSHAAAYAVVAYRTAYLKAHYPTEFMAALMTSFMGGDGSKIAQYIRNCKELGVDVLPPCILKSDRKFSVEDGKIRMGLRGVKNCGDGAIDSIITLRGSGVRLESIRDFVDHIDASSVNTKAAESLIYAGAFDCIQSNRASALRMYKLFSEQAKKERGKVIEGQGSLFDIIREDINQSDEGLIGPDFEMPQKLALEKEVLGMYFSGHPLDDFRWIIDEVANVTSDELNNPKDYPERRAAADVIIVGQITSVKNFVTKKGGQMAVILLEDLVGTIEVVVFPGPYEKSGDVIRENEIVVVRGKDERDSEGAVRILASKVTPIEKVEDYLQKRGQTENCEK